MNDKAVLGVAQRVSLCLEPRVVAQWDSAQQQWSIAGEEYEISQATDAASPVLQGKVTLTAQTFSYR